MRKNVLRITLYALRLTSLNSRRFKTMNAIPPPPIRIAVVGVCASGKSSLVRALREAGYDARHVAQEHSYAPQMWRRIARPDILIYLDVDFETLTQRRRQLRFGPAELAEQLRRLAHARAHCDLYVDTSSLSVDEVRTAVFDFLEKSRLVV
jgi:deoxyadenosine/deoxycytidine kinase